MKKGYAIIALMLGGIICIALFAAANLFIMPFTAGIASIILLFFFMKAADRLRELFRDKYQIGCIKFLLLAELPSFVLSAAAFWVVMIMARNGYWEGELLGGVFELLLSLSGGITALLLMLGAILGSFAERMALRKIQRSTEINEV